MAYYRNFTSRNSLCTNYSESLADYSPRLLYEHVYVYSYMLLGIPRHLEPTAWVHHSLINYLLIKTY